MVERTDWVSPPGKLADVSKKNRKNAQNDNVPAGMSRRQAKLAARAAERAAAVGVTRPFADLPMEADLVAFREFVPNGTMAVTVAGAKRDITIVTLLPGAAAALTRDEEHGNTGYVALQTKDRSANPQQDLARALQWAATAPAGAVLESTVSGTGAELEAPELSTLLTDAEPAVAEKSFEWWLPGGLAANPAAAENIRQADETIMHSERVNIDLPGAIWWIDTTTRAHFRWIRTEAESKLFDALARVHAADGLTLGEGTKFAGVFRTQGVLVPVWDLDRTRAFDTYEQELTDLNRRIDAALAATEPLTADERKSRDTIRSRQVTIN